ncbi:trichohyalin isoform X1 [Nilaparvata lugens]|uniref:trichohyalin isoform X1 n=1 Tax=Nilaparvata lugens TaxID=108931 RepID=UPI00193EA307|nr:trichohyalin isoform X1 [Nilaparvata lugens]
MKRLENTLCQEIQLLRRSVERLLSYMQEHYSGNRSRNAIVREDFPKALDEQKREEEEAMARYLQMTRLQEERDARLAKEFEQRIKLEEEEKLRRRLHEDEAIASQIQEKELQRTKEVGGKNRHLSAAVGSSQTALATACLGDVNSVGLPLPAQLPPPITHAHKNTHQQQHHQHHLQQLTKQFRATNVQEDLDEPDLTDLEFQEEMMRQMQEKKDEELAKLLQQQEEEMDSLGMVDKDRLMAIEAQDKELAKLLQDRERAKARRARERAKQRALLKKQQQQERDGAEREVGEMPSPSRPNNLDVIRINKPKMPEPEEIESVASGCSGGGGGGVHTLPTNIAMAIDPTYTPPHPTLSHHSTTTTSSSISSPSYSLPSPDFEEEDDSPVPPYMPIQGQRRTSSLEKKHKKNKKDSCKQQ